MLQNGFMALLLLTGIGYAEQEAGKIPEEHQSYESELKNIEFKIQNLRNLFLGHKNIVENKNQVTKSSQLAVILERANGLYDKKMYYSAVSEYQQYLLLYPQIEGEKFLDIEKKLATAFEAIKNVEKSKVHYENFISSFISQRKTNWDDLLWALRRRADIPEIKTKKGPKGSSNFLSAILSLNLPLEEKYEVFYLSAQIAKKEGETELAQKWLANAASFTTNDKTKVKALYFQGLIALSLKQLGLAEQCMQEVLASSEDTDVIRRLKEYSSLILGRIYAHQEKYNKALFNYSNISGSSKIYDRALLEKSFVLIQLHEFTQAQMAQTEFLTKFSDKKDSYRVKVLVSYLELLSGHLNAAENSIKSQQDILANYAKWIQKSFLSEGQISRDQIYDLYELSEERVQHSPLLLRLMQLFRTIDIQNNEMMEVKRELRNFYYTLGNMEEIALFPEWKYRSQQYQNLVSESITLANHLMEMNAALFGKMLKGEEEEKISASEERRKILSDPLFNFKNIQKNHWKEFYRFLELEQNAIRFEDKCDNLLAELAGYQYVDQQKTNAVVTGKINEDIRESKKIVFQKKEKILKILEKIRFSRIENAAQLNPFLVMASNYSKIRSFFKEEVEIYQKYHVLNKNLVTNYLIKDLEQSWMLWDAFSSELEETLKSTSHEAFTSIKKEIAIHEKMMEKSEKIENELSIREKQIQFFINNSKGVIAAHYVHATNELLAKNQQWLGDISFLRFNEKNHRRMDILKKSSKDEQALKETFFNLKEGFLSKWPE